MCKPLTQTYWRILGFGLAAFMGQSVAYADISGRVFHDFNGNAAFDTGNGFNEIGLAGITVKAYDDTDALSSPSATATTAADGAYVLTGLTSGEKYRLEFSWSGTWLKSGKSGGTTVQFTSDGATNADVALADPQTYCQVEPKLATPQFINGDPTAGGTAATLSSWLMFDYSSAGSYSNTSTILATAAEMGSVWGEAYQRSTKTLFSAATVRRHSGLGKIDGKTTTGGIYSVNLANGSTYGATPWLDVNTLSGVNTGGDPRIEEGSSLPADKEAPSHDVLAFSEVGKRGLGDIDISADDKTLYAVNLYQRSLLSIDIASKSLNTALPIPNPGCVNDDYRPWGLAVHQGSVYVGIVCSAETSRNVADLRAYVQRVDGSSFTTVYDFSLNYDRSDLGGGLDGDWQPWARTWADTQFPAGGGWPMGSATPMLADIEFDTDGSMVLGFLDRTGMQSGLDNYSTDTGSTATFENEAGGDLLHVCNTNTGWVMEGNAGCITAGGTNNNQGPNGSEYYYADNFVGGHTEATTGGVALLAGTNHSVVVGYDPLSSVRTGGIRWLDNTSGALVRGYELYPDSRYTMTGTMGKAVGLGDLEMLCDPAPVEVGNRIWRDNDGDGIQDAGEAGIDGVNVTLACGTDTASVITANGGLFTFSSATNATFMQPGENCTVRVDNTQTPISSYVLTVMNADGQADNNAQTDIRDSDALNNGTTAEVGFTVGSVGENNHALDIGYREQPKTDVALTKTVDKSTAKPGETVVYTLTATNQSTTDATGVQVTDLLPNAVVYVSDDGNGSYEPNSGVWSIGDIAAGQSKTLLITVTVK